MQEVYRMSTRCMRLQCGLGSVTANSLDFDLTAVILKKLLCYTTQRF